MGGSLELWLLFCFYHMQAGQSGLVVSLSISIPTYMVGEFQMAYLALSFGLVIVQFKMFPHSLSLQHFRFPLTATVWSSLQWARGMSGEMHFNVLKVNSNDYWYLTISFKKQYKIDNQIAIQQINIQIPQYLCPDSLYSQSHPTHHTLFLFLSLPHHLQVQIEHIIDFVSQTSGCHCVNLNTWDCE